MLLIELQPWSQGLENVALRAFSPASPTLCNVEKKKHFLYDRSLHPLLFYNIKRWDGVSEPILYLRIFQHNLSKVVGVIEVQLFLPVIPDLETVFVCTQPGSVEVLPDISYMGMCDCEG